MNLSIARRLSLMIAIAVLSLLAVGITGAWVSGSLSKKLDESTNTTLPAIEALDQIPMWFEEAIGESTTSLTESPL